jgi:thioredoxin-like negative regulator of GroEL
MVGGVKRGQNLMKHFMPTFEPVSKMSRREKIEAMLAEDPGDTFLRYSLAMELRSEGEHQKSLAQLDELMNENPACVAAFFMAAQQLVELDRIDDARRHLRDGIEHARSQGDSHAAAEMSQLLTSLGELGEL